MKLKLLTTAVCASLALTAWADGALAGNELNLTLPASSAIGTAALAQGQSSQDQDQNQSDSEKKKTKQLEQIVVTGSLIPRAQIETATPTVQITAEDIKAQGFKSVYEALKASPFATGGVTGAQDSATFTQGAKTLSLFGLDPGFTLYLVDGHPLADYPLLYNGRSNIVDLGSIPTAMVDHIDIVPGNQSAIYGSSAIAGVVNIVLKQNVEGIDASVRIGGYSEGGGSNQRLQLVGGHSFGKLNAVFGIQYDHTAPIWAYQRDWAKSYTKNPDGSAVASRDRLIYGYAPPYRAEDYGYFDAPSPDSCNAISNLFNGTEKYATRSGGSYCGSTETIGYTTLGNKDTNVSGYLSLKMPLGDNAQAYATALYNHDKVFYNVGSSYTWWGTGADFGYSFDPNTGNLFLAQWAFAPEEVGGYDSIGSNLTQDSYNSTIGVRGNFGDSDWAYDAYYDRSQQWVHTNSRERIASKIDAFFMNKFLGPILGYTGPYPVFSPDWDAFYGGAVTPEEYRSFTEIVHSRSQSWMQHLNFVATNTSLFDLPGGSAGIAALLQVGNQHWSKNPDPRYMNGEIWGTVSTEGHGTRENYAGALEMNLPLFSWLTVDGSARYDNYKYAGRSDGKATYKLGLELRPIDTLLFRANYSTAFRAPDMGRIFLTPSGFYNFATDYYWCDTNEPDASYDDCTYGSVQYKGTQEGNRNLKDINAESWGAGIVWSPTNNFNLRLDYIDLKIDDEVSDLSADKILFDEAQCRQGEMDINSPTCVDAIARVHRDTRGVVDGVIISPINISKENVKAITAGGDYRFDMGRAGSMTLGFQYNNILKHEYQQYAGDEFIDLLQPGYTTDYKTILSGSASWEVGNWTTTLYGVRYGKRPNYAANYIYGDFTSPGTARTPAWVLFNASVNYDLPHDASISIIVNNLMNKMPPRDKTFTSWPYYETQAYNIYGRSIFAEFEMHFGG